MTGTSAPWEAQEARVPAAPPAWRPPAGGWDTHAHVFGSPAAFPQRPDRRYIAPLQPVELYLAVLDAVGISYGVLVQASVYAQDNSCLLAALDAAPGRLIGVVDVDVTAAAGADLSDMARRGVRGLRLTWTPAHPDGLLREQCARLRDLGWHLNVRVEDVEHMTALSRILPDLAVPVMIEAMGSPRAGSGLDSPGFAALLAVLEAPDVYVKLSHPHQIDPGGPPYDGTLAFARAIISRAPSRAVWGSDWPHPMPAGEIMPDDAALIDLLVRWTGDADLAAQVLRDNASRFYGGPPRGTR